MALNRSNLATAETPINNELGSLYSYPQWKQINSDEDLTTDQDLPQYLDYYRTELFKRGELTREKEADIQNYYVNWASNGEEVSDEDYAALANQSTAYQSGSLNDERIVNRVFPNVDFAAIDTAKQNEYLNRAKKSLMASGELPFATILEGGRGTVQVGDYDVLGTSPDKKKLASQRALSAVTLGAVDPRDLWQVSEGLESTRVPGKTNFESDLDEEDLGILREMLGDKDSPYAKTINDAIVNSIDLETYRTKGNWLQQIFADRPEKITQILSEELPEEIEDLTPIFLNEFAKRKGWGDAEAAGISVDNSYRFSNERIANLIKELSIVHTNNQGAFKYDEDKPENNLRLTPMGVPIAHPTVMENPKAFNELLKDDRLTPSQRKALSESRRNYMYSRSYHIDDVLSSDHLESAVGDKWARAKAENPQKWKEDRVAFVDEFLSNEKNYDASKNWWGGVRASVPEAIVGIGASIGALLGNDASANYLKESQKKQSQRRELDGLFGGEFGVGYDLATILPAVGADLASTYFLAGPLTKGAKALGVGRKLDNVASKEQAIKRIANEAAIDPKKTPLAIGRFNEQTAQKFGITSSLFLTSANRSAGATYASIYNSLPEDMSHEEKHDKALGAAFARGTLTGVITSGFSAFGAGGLENIVAKGASFRQFKNAINNVPNVAFKANEETTKALLRNTIAKQAAELYKKEANSTLIKKALGSAAAEGAEEGLDEFIGSFVDSAVLNEFVPMKERISQGLYAGGLGSILGGTMTVGSETFFGPDRLLKSTNVKSEENKKTVALNTALAQASQALDEAGLVISAEQLQESLKVTNPIETKEAGAEAPVAEDVTVVGDAEIEGAVEEFEETLAEKPTSRTILTNFGSKLTKEDVADYISGWVPTNTKEDIFIQYVDGKLPDNNPMRVGINAGTTDNPNIVLQIDTDKITAQLKDLKGKEARKKALDTMLAHEFVHVSESSLLKDMWRKRSSQEEGLNFLQFSKKKLTEVYESLAKGEGIDKLRNSVAVYKGMEVDDVILPGELEPNSEQSPTMEADEIVSEFTRQFIESETKLTDITKDKGFLEFLQDLVQHVRGFLDPNVQESKDQYSFINKSVAKYLNDIEAAYTNTLASSIRGRFVDFEKASKEKLEVEDVELSVEPEETPITTEDSLWLKANEVSKRKITNKGVRNQEETAEKVQQANIEKVEAYLLSDPEVQQSIPNFNRAKLDVIRDKYVDFLESVSTRKEKITFPEISQRGSENYVEGVAVGRIKDIMVTSKVSGDTVDTFLIKVLNEFGTNVATETQAVETIIDNNPPSAIYLDEGPALSANSQETDFTTETTEGANELLVDAAVHVRNNITKKYIVRTTNSPNLAAVTVDEGVLEFNKVALIDALSSYRKTKGEEASLNGYLESEFTIKSIEDTFLNDNLSVESFADLGIDDKFLSFISSENDLLFDTGIFSEEDIEAQGDEVVKSIAINAIKKLTAEAVSGKDYRDSLTILNSFPKLKEIAMQSLDNSIDLISQSLDKDLASDVSKELALKLDSLGTARTHLRKGYVFNPEKMIVYNGGATAEAGLEQIRNVITKADDPQALTDIEKEFRTLIEVPIGQLGSYTSPVEGKPNWIKTFWSWFTGLKDPRWKREMERRESFMNGIRTEVESYIGQIERLVNEGWGGFTAEINTLLEQATGERNNINVSEEVDAVFIAERDAAKLAARDLENPKDVIEAVKKADRDYESAVIKEKQRIRQETLARVDQALNKISEKSPELAETLRGLRFKITASSRYISEQLSKIDKDEYTDIEARFSAQEGFYLTRSYRIFQDASWKEFIFSKDNPKAKALRLNAAREIFKQNQENEISAEVIKKDKEAYANNDVDWITKSESAKRAEFSGLAKTLAQALETEGQSEEAFLEATFKNNFSKYGEDLDADVLKKKQDLPKAVREALGEIPDGTWNVVKTYENVSYLVNRLAVDANLERLGTAGEPDQRWLVTREQRNELGLDDYQLIDTALKTDKDDVFSPLIGKGYYAPPELINDIQEARTFVQEGTRLTDKLTKSINGIVRKSIGYSLGIKTLTSTTYYIRNIVGNTTYFALSLGLPPGTGITKIKGELARAITSPKEVNEYVNKLVKDGVIEREFSVALYEDMVNGLITEESLREQTSDLLNELQKENGLPPIEADSDKSLLDTLKQVGKKGYKISKKLENKLQKLSLASDSFYKIAVYEYELNNLQEARAYDDESGIDTGFKGKSDRELELMAIDKLKKTAQYFSQNMPGTEAFSRSTAGALVAPYYRFRAEVGRIMVNNTMLAAQEIKSKNPVIRKRGLQRAAGAATVGAVSTVATFAAEAALLIFVYGLGHRPADDLGDEEKEALQLSVPSYLRNHTFLYTKKNGKYYSWDLTYLNPYSTYLDAFPAIQRSLGRGESPLEAMGHGMHILFSAPFLEGQIATKAFYNMLNNKNSKDEAIFFEHDDLGTKAAKGLASFAKEAYGAPTFMRLSENIKGMLSDDPTYTMSKLLRDEFSPLKPYEIKPQTALYNFTRPIEQDKLAMRKALNKLATSKPVSDDELRDTLQNLVNSYKRSAKTFKRHAPAFPKLGATPEQVRKIGGELFTKEGYKNIMLNNYVPALFFSNRMKEVFKNSSNPEVRARLSKAASFLLEQTENGFISLE